MAKHPFEEYEDVSKQGHESIAQCEDSRCSKFVVANETEQELLHSLDSL